MAAKADQSELLSLPIEKMRYFWKTFRLSRKHLGNLFVKNYPKILPSLPLSPLAKHQVLLKPDVFKRPKDTTSVGSLLPHTHIIHTRLTYIHKSHPHIPNIFYPFSISFICSFFVKEDQSLLADIVHLWTTSKYLFPRKLNYAVYTTEVKWTEWVWILKENIIKISWQYLLNKGTVDVLHLCGGLRWTQYIKHVLKGIVSWDFEWLQMILMKRLYVPDVSLEVYSF